MGQYFRPCIIDDDNRVVQSLYSHEYGYGLKLGEHGTQRSEFAALFEILLVLDVARRVVWAGDYAPKEPGSEDNLWDMVRDEHWVHFDWQPRGENFFMSRFEGPKVPLPIELPTAQSHPFVLNHDTRQYVDKAQVPEHPRWPGEQWHPLVLLTAEGSSLSSYVEDDPEHQIGSWSRQRISISQNRPDWEELKFSVL